MRSARTPPSNFNNFFFLKNKIEVLARARAARAPRRAPWRVASPSRHDTLVRHVRHACTHVVRAYALRARGRRVHARGWSAARAAQASCDAEFLAHVMTHVVAHMPHVAGVCQNPRSTDLKPVINDLVPITKSSVTFAVTLYRPNAVFLPALRMPRKDPLLGLYTMRTKLQKRFCIHSRGAG